MGCRGKSGTYFGLLEPQEAVLGVTCDFDEDGSRHDLIVEEIKRVGLGEECCWNGLVEGGVKL